MAKFDVYEEVTNQIIDALEQGVKPWECPWQSECRRPALAGHW